MTMFRCKACGGNTFKMVVQPHFQGSLEIYSSAADDVMIRVGTQEFVADLAFINRFAACQDCGQTHQWEYFYPHAEEAATQRAQG